MKRLVLLLFGLLLFLLPRHAPAQTTQERCTQGACYNYGPPVGGCVGATIYSDLSQGPVQAYSCYGGAWTKNGGGGGGSAVATVVIASVGSPHAAKADVLCPVTASQTCINAAIQASCNGSVVEGCRVYLDVGFHITGSVIIDGDNIDISGMNHTMWGGYNGPWTSTSQPAGGVGTGANLIADSGSFPLLVMQHNNLHGTGVSDTGRHRGTNIHDLYLVGYQYTGVGIQEDTMDDTVQIHDNTVQRVATGIWTYLDSPVITHNSLQDLLAGIYVGGVFARIADNLIFDVGGVGITDESANSTLTGNIIGDCFGGGISTAGGATNVTIANNQLATNNGIDIYLNYADMALVTGNQIDKYSSQYGFSNNGTFPTFANAIYVINSTGVTVGNNGARSRLGQGGAFVYLDTTTTSSIVANNTVLGPWAYGGSPIHAGSNTTSVNVTPFVAANPDAISSGILQAWYKASSITGVTSGAAITSWPDSSGFGRNLSVAAGGPLYEATSTIHSGPAVRLNGTSDILQETEMVLPQSTQPRTVFVVFNMSATASSKGRATTLIAPTIDSNNVIYIDSSTNDAAYYAFTPANASSAIAASTTYVGEWVFNGATSRISINGTATTGLNPGNGIWTKGLTVGANNSHSGEWFPGDIAEILIYSTALSGPDSSTKGAALCAAYGVTCGTGW